MPKERLLTEAAVLILSGLLIVVAAGRNVPFFNASLWFALTLLVAGVIWQALAIFRAPTRDDAPKKAGTNGRVAATFVPSRPAGGYRLVVVDVDGTLAGRDQQVSPRVRAALGATKERGVEVALCTGRSIAATRGFTAALDLRSAHIFFDGALVAAPDAPSDIYCCPPDPEALRELAALCRREALTLELYSRDAHFVARHTPESDWHATIQGIAPQVVDFDSLLAEETIVKGELVALDGVASARIAALAPRFAGRLRLSWAKVPGHEQFDLVNVVHPGVSKGEALRRLAAHFGVPLEAVLAVGDGPNDIPLLEAAGLGIAMGNAPPAVKAAAGVVTDAVSQDGLASAIERFVLT